MKIKQEIGLLPWVHKSKKRPTTGRAPLYIRVTLDGSSEEVSLKHNVLPEAWDEKNKVVLPSDPEFKKINVLIENAKVDLRRTYDKLWHQFDRVTELMVKRAYNGLSPMATEELPGERYTLLQAFDDFINRYETMVERGTRSKGTLRHWRSTRSKVALFIYKKYNKTDLPLIDIRPSFGEEMYDFFTLSVSEPLADPTIKKHIKKTKQIIKNTVKKQVITANPLEGFKCGGDIKEVDPLEYHQVLRIYNKDFSIERLNRVRDAFIFQCFTGFAYQDIAGLAKENIVLYGTKAERWLVKERGKTKVTEMVPVLPVIDELIAKYEQDPYCMMTGKLIPIISNCNYNGYLKEIATICNIDRNLNTHLARHTFADIMLNSGVPLEDVSKMLGHKSIRTTQRYCRVRKERISENMEIIRTRLFSKSGKLKGIKRG